MTEDRISMNSLGNLHGRVDFFGIETRNENKHIYEQLKRARRWNIFEGCLIAVMLSYLILLTVWLAPFSHPMKFDAGDETEINAAKIVTIQAEYTNVQDKVKSDAEKVRVLQQWRLSHTKDSEKMKREIHELLRDLQNETASIRTTAMDLNKEVERLTSENNAQDKRITEMTKRLNKMAVGMEKSKSSIDELNKRRNLSDGEIATLQKTVELLNSTMQNSFLWHSDLLNETAYTVSSEARNLVQGTKEHLSGELARGQSEMSSRFRQIRVDLNKCLQDIRNVSKQEIRRQDEYLSEKLKQDADIANLTEGLRGLEKNSTEFRENSIAADRDLRIKLHSLEGDVDDHRKQFVRLDIRVNNTERVVENLSRQLDKDISSLELSLNERIDGADAETDKRINKTKIQIVGTRSDLIRLNRTTQRLDRENRNLDAEIANVTGGLSTHKAEYVRFHRESNTANHNLWNKLNILDGEVVIHRERLLQISAKMNSTESNLGNLSRQLKKDMISVETSLLSALSESVTLHSNRTERMREQLNGLMTTVRKQNLTITQDHKRFSDEIVMLKECSLKVEDLTNRMSTAEKRINETADELLTRIKQQSNRSVAVEMGMKTLQSDMEHFNETMRYNVLWQAMALNETASSVISEAGNLVRKEKVIVLDKLAHVQDEVNALIEQTERNLSKNLHRMMRNISDEKKLQQSEGIHGNEKQDDEIAKVTDDLRKHNENFAQFQQVSLTSNNDLQNKTALLEDKAGVQRERLIQLHVKVNRTEKKLEELSLKLEEDIFRLNEFLNSSIVELSSGQKNLSDVLTQVHQQHAQLVRDLEKNNQRAGSNEMKEKEPIPYDYNDYEETE